MNILLTCEIDKTKRILYFSAHEAGIWVARLYIDPNSVASSFWVAGFGGNLDDVPKAKTTISSFITGSTIHARMLSLDDLRTISAYGFFWDSASQDLYVKFNDLQPWYIQRSIRAGETFKYSTKAQKDFNGRPTNATIDDLDYSPRVKEGSISDQRVEDNLRDNRMVMSDFSFDIDNADGDLDSVREDVINLGGRIKYASVPNGASIVVDDLKVIRNGFIDNVSFPDDTLARFSCSDPRSIMDSKIKTNLLTQAEFTDLNDNLVDKNKPIAIGKLLNIPAVRLQATNLDPPDTPYWHTEWVNSTDYIIGDSIHLDTPEVDHLHYVCILGHKANTPINRPTTGSSWETYWELDTVGIDDIDFLICDTSYGNITTVSDVYLDGSIFIRNESEGRWDRKPYDGTEPLVLGVDYAVDLNTGILHIVKFAGGKVSLDCVGSQPLATELINDHIKWFLEEFIGYNYIESFFFTQESNIVLARSSAYTGGYYVGTRGSKLKEIIDDLASSVNLRVVEKEDRFTFIDLFVPTDVSNVPVIKNERLMSTPPRDWDEDRYMSSIRALYNKDWSEDEYTDSLDDSNEAEAIEANSKHFTYEFKTNIDNKTHADLIATERYSIAPPLHIDIELIDEADFEMYDYIMVQVQRRNGTVIQTNGLYRVVELSKADKTARLRWIKSVAITEGQIPTIIITEYQQGYLSNNKLYEHKLYSVTQGVL